MLPPRFLFLSYTHSIGLHRWSQQIDGATPVCAPALEYSSPWFTKDRGGASNRGGPARPHRSHWNSAKTAPFKRIVTAMRMLT
jgi:hypothetical protein